MTFKELLKIIGGKLISGKGNEKIKGFSTDTRKIKRGEVFIALKGENFDGHFFLKEALKKKAKGAIVSQKVKLKNFPLIYVKNTAEALLKIGAYFRDNFKGKVIAITGSNGKTTTKEMIGKILSKKYKVLKAEKSYNNKIGVPLTLLKLSPFFKICVLELGGNHLKEIEELAKVSKPEIALITNIGKAHLGYFKGLKGVFRAKKEILKSPKIKILIANEDDPFLRKIKFSPKITFAIKNKADYQGKILKIEPERTIFQIKRIKINLPLPGFYNVYNALSAIVVGRIFKVPFSKIKKALESYRPLPLRSEIKKVKKATLFLDCYNANPTSVELALGHLSSFPLPKVIVLGDMLELGRYCQNEHRKIGKLIEKLKPKAVLFVGKNTFQSFKAIKDSSILKYWSKDLDKAKEFIKPFFDLKCLIFIKGSRKIQLEKIIL